MIHRLNNDDDDIDYDDDVSLIDCQANFNFLPPSLIVDMRRAKFLCKIFTMENYDYSVIMKQAKTDYASLCHTYGVSCSQGYYFTWVSSDIKYDQLEIFLAKHKIVICCKHVLNCV